MARLHLLAAAAVLAPVLLAGCGGNEPEPQLPDTAPSPSSTPSASPAAEATQEPTLPPEAEGNDEAAAEAFVRYYWDAVDYAQLTGDLKALKKLSLPSCASCNSGNEYVSNMYANGGSLQGVDYTVNRVRLAKRSDGADFGTYRAEAELSNGAYTEQASSSAEPVDRPAGTGTAVMDLTWDKTGFSVATWTLR
ncbi:DUF6318 family protein [uncultured Nocardioides sp.]|uniref:DUF6318 family protein n=1 Tax=uncultured Nocardioides sp. TaxID=198441 RepID=UPI0025F7C350|nr:DUF6318 family protein [uncultured Nocardioides sp.]